MSRKRFLVEFGFGADVHGRDITNACKKAIKNAMSHCCLCGVRETLGLENPMEEVSLKIKLGCTRPEQADCSELKKLLPYKNVEIEAVHGGLSEKGILVPAYGSEDDIEFVVAAITVYVEVD